MESLPNSFFVNNLPDLSTKANFNPTTTLLRIPFCPSLFFSPLLILFGFCYFIRRGGGVVGVASLFSIFVFFVGVKKECT